MPLLKTIGKSAFNECINLQEFALADSVTSIGDAAFFGAASLKQVSFPAGLKSIGSEAYKNCSLFTNIILPDNMDYVASSVFANCRAVQEMRVPLAGQAQTKYPKSIRDYIVAYDDDYNPIVSRVELTKDTTVIAGYAFANLQELEELILPDTIVKFENNALNNMPKISKLDVAMATEYGYSLISGCPNLKELTIRLYTAADTAKPGYYRYYFEYEWGFVPENEMQSITKVIVKGDNTTLAKGTFRGSNKLEEVTLPDSLTKISDETFAYCTALKSVNIPSGVKEIGSDAFIGCSSLTGIDIPSGVYAIDKNAFRNCTALEAITFPQDSAINALGDSAFAGCTALQSVSFPSFSIWQLSYGLFSDCASLKTIALPQSLQYIRTSAFERSGLQAIVIPERVRVVDWFAFKDCKALQTVDIQYSDKFGLYEIGREAFAGCSALSSIVLPPSLSDIVGRAFADCTALSNVYVQREYDYRISPNNKCTALRIGTRDDGISDNVFDNCSPDIKFFVPIKNGDITESNPLTGAKNGVDAYKTLAQGWGDYADRIYPLPDLLPNT